MIVAAEGLKSRVRELLVEVLSTPWVRPPVLLRPVSAGHEGAGWRGSGRK